MALAAMQAEQSVHLIAAARAEAVATGAERANMLRTHARALRMAGLIAEQRGQPEHADDWFHQALDLAREIGPGETAYEVQLTYADVLSDRGAYQEAARYYRAVVGQQHGRLPSP